MPIVHKRTAQPITHVFADDGNIPNNVLPLVLYRGGYVHYHSMIHEAMAVARGRAKVRFGGDNGEVIDVMAGDVVVLPAGTGHQRLSQTPDLVVIGAYPPNGQYNLCRGSKAEHAQALAVIPNVPPPEADPVFGPDGPLLALWRV